MPEICILPPEIVNRIAAGEVVERPASLIKELVENSIDAHATEVDIDLEDGGKKKVTVRDNGCGISPRDLPLAFRSHATSKLSEADLTDGLFGITTLGFRGEALASIGAVADVEVVSRHPGAEHAYRYRPGELEAEPAAGPQGTVVEVRDIFYKLPARRKFLRAGSTELSHVLEQVTRLALGFPGIRFRLTQKGKRLLDLPPASSLRERVEQVVGRERAGGLIEVRGGEEANPPLLYGFVGSPEIRRKDSREQHFFVNGRWVRDRLLSHALRSAFQGFLIAGWQPVAYLFLDFPPDAVDINVHPTKTEVRFRDPGAVYPLVFHSLRRSLDADRETSGEDGSVSEDASGHAASRDASLAGRERQRIRQAALDFLSSKRTGGGRPPLRRFAGGPGARPSAPPTQRLPFAGAPSESPTASQEDRREGPAPRPFGAGASALQVLDAYIVIEDGDGLSFIDQHALHEKILFEEIYRSLLDGRVLSQKLLVPEVIELPVEYMPLVERARAWLAPCGFAIEEFGDREIAVQAVPRLFERLEAKGGSREFLLDVFRWLRDEGSELEVGPPRDSCGLVSRPYRRLASLLACKRAVKAGARLGAEEIESLIERADLAADPRHCPHGRPTSVRLSRRELDRMFDRK